MSVRRFLKRRLERRRSPRIQPEELVAYYWTGAVPDPRKVREIGLYGACIVAPEAFYPGTLVQIVFEDKAASLDDGSVNPHLCVYAKMLRRTADGFCVAFLFDNAVERRTLRGFLRGVRRKTAEEAGKPERTEGQGGAARLEEGWESARLEMLDGTGPAAVPPESTERREATRGLAKAKAR